MMLDPDRLLAPFLREAGLDPKAESYGNWESSGLDGHTAGHYLSALSMMVASAHDTDAGELSQRLDYMLGELDRCQIANRDGYIGGVPGSHAFWAQVSAGYIDANNFGINGKWVPWYNIHKTFAGLRDAYVIAGRQKAYAMLIQLGDWCVKLIADLSDEQMQEMLQAEHGGMNEVLADVYAITGKRQYLDAAKRFNHSAVLDPLVRHEDQLTGLHANTQIPKVIGLQRIASLTDQEPAHRGAEFFWHNVADRRSVAFGGNSVSEHFHAIDHFGSMVEHREGPETCNTYNMLRLSEMLFEAEPLAAYADYYERALYNHLLAAIHPSEPGYVYFTPLRPQHYRVYSQPEQCFWCCVGSGMENPGRYGQFIYAQGSGRDIYVNLFIPSELVASDGLTLRQTTSFPDEPRTRFAIHTSEPTAFTLLLRHPAWVGEGQLVVKVNGEVLPTQSKPSSYVELHRQWQDGDVIDLELPMHISAERLPDGSDWVSILYGPIVLAAPSGSEHLDGLRADGSRMGHIASGPLVSLDQVEALVCSFDEIPANVVPDEGGAALEFKLTGIVKPEVSEGLTLNPFFRLHDTRYQMIWPLAAAEHWDSRVARMEEEDRQRVMRELLTVDRVAVGEQQPEIEHGFLGRRTETGMHNGRRWRRGEWFEYTLDTGGEVDVALEVTYWVAEQGRGFRMLVNGVQVMSDPVESLQPGSWVSERILVSKSLRENAKDGLLKVRFIGSNWLEGGLADVRLIKRETVK